MLTQQQAGEALARWLVKNQPQVFEALMRRASGVPLRSVDSTTSSLAGLTDFLSTIGTTVSGAVKSVGTFLASPDGLKTLTSIGGVYLAAQSQKEALKLQTARAAAGMEPAPVTTYGVDAVNPYSAFTDGKPITRASAQRYLPTGMPAWVPWAAGGALLLLVILMRK